MFATNTAVSDTARERVASYRRLTQSDALPPPTLALPELQQPRVASPSARADRAVLSLLSLLSTTEDVRRAYPDPPAALRGNTSATTAAESLAHPTAAVTTEPAGAGPTPSSHSTTVSAKRPRAALGAVQQLNKETVLSSDAAMISGAERATVANPAMTFAEGFETVDYMGRSFLEPPVTLVQQAPVLQEKPCQPPRTLRGAFKGGHEAGVQQLRWTPPTYAHLLCSTDLQGVAKLWNSQTRQCVATYHAHAQPIKSLEVTTLGATMSTGSVDGTVAMWDVEAGLCRSVLTNAELLPVVQHLHHPSNEENLLLVAVDRKVVLYDVRVSCKAYQMEYTGHMGTIFNLSLLSGGTKLLTTAEDKTLRTWDYRIPVQIKQFADAGMHAITHVVAHPTENMLAAQSLDNKVIVFRDDGAGKLKLLRQREFTGHNISGTRCQLAFSRDGRYLSSGDITGSLFVWQWSTAQLVKSFKAHSQMLVSHLWHPLEASHVVTGAWDGSIKNWA